MSKPRPFGLRAIFAVPAAVAAVSAFGLVAALIGDGIWDVVGWAALGVSVAVPAWALIARRRA